MATMSLMLMLAMVWVAAVGVKAEMVEVQTPDGTLRGRSASFMGKTINTLLGIPFGQASRFQESKPADSWTGVRDALSYSAMCPQIPDTLTPGLPMSEDCLYLNVFAPEPEDSEELLPVMVWIHGGAYKTGTAAYYNGTALAAKGVVVVTINYRLDVLGFLSTEDFGCPGNLGLLDQLLGLQWVQKSIASFHGNSSDVTIFGESAGAGSVSLLRMSPMAKGLFTKAIMESGVSLSPWALAQDTDVTPPAKWASIFGNEMGCPENSTVNMVSCLMSFTTDKLLEASRKLLDRNHGNLIFKPVVLKSQGLIPYSPMEMMQQGFGSDVISLRGVNKDEYALFYFRTPLSYFTQAQVQTNLDILTKTYFPHDPTTVKAAMMKEYYKGFNSSSHEQLRADCIQLVTDMDFVAPTVFEMQMVLNASKGAKEYFYEYVYRPTNYNVPTWAGVPHASELPIVFGQPFVLDRFFAHSWDFTWSGMDKTVSDDVMTMWTNFAKYGNPTPEAVGQATWAPYTMEKQNYLVIGDSLSMKTDFKSEHIQFWKEQWHNRP